MRRKINILLILRVDSLTVIKWWVGASYAAHPYMRGNTWAIVSLGISSVTGITKKHINNAKSSTEAELIGAYNAMTRMLWTQ